ncbi:PEP-CTERM sorting domain-containing protein [Alginatibacterium sediminis]|uniref:PEP-CTERM sorting domain-containing protein n=1 Tax=Alginatibacterium sediminis TaxID=2164068 RepID=A0A420ELC6_9ALTE|nr:PEP-CTERM sorting domain-containing protein [Alginatibacterium sediminis]RKF21522.1 PEP-CTERM sorting domain-containing protein [Alginatibacterium sediminis]
MFAAKTLKFVRCWFALLLLCVSSSSIASPLKCNNLSVSSGGFSNLLSGSPCVVDDGDQFSWNASDIAGSSYNYSYNISLGSESLSDVANVLGFMTDYGLSHSSLNGNYNGTYSFLDDNGFVIESLIHLGKDSYGSDQANSGLLSGTWLTPVAANFMTVKSAQSFLLYYYSPGQTSGAWSTDGIFNQPKGKNQAQQQGVSHINWWALDSVFSPVVFDVPPAPSIPEPSSIILLLLSAIAMCFKARKAERL